MKSSSATSVRMRLTVRVFSYDEPEIPGVSFTGDALTTVRTAERALAL